MQPRWKTDGDNLLGLDRSEVRVLSFPEEREILGTLAECRRKLSEAMARIERPDALAGGDDLVSLAQSIASYSAGDGPSEAGLGATARRYSELRSKLALANLRLVAHVAKQFRDRGIAYSDLLQEGFCGLLEAIDRFDMSHGTKLATYATWWIRQAMQRAVASGAYPVRLSPRHLRQLARNQDQLGTSGGDASAEMIHRVHTATRPTVSLNVTKDTHSTFSLIETITAPDDDDIESADRDETISRLLQSLRPREQRVLAFRFGLEGKPRLSLSQIGTLLAVSKERVRQIQDRALEKLRVIADEQNLSDLIQLGS
jgi:RNA polymerase primary sigma factor